MEYISVVPTSNSFSLTSSQPFLANIYCATIGAWFNDASCQKNQSTTTDLTTSQVPNSKPQVPNTNQINSQSSTPNLQPSSTSNTPAFSPHTPSRSSPSSPNIINQGLTYADVNTQIQVALSKALGAQANYAGQNVTYAPVYQQISAQANSIGTSIGNAVGDASTNLTSSFNSAISSGLTGGTSAFNGTSLTVSSSTVIGGNTTIGGSLVSGSTTLSHLNVSGDTNIAGTLTVNSLVSGGQTIGGNFNVTGITTLATTSITGALTVIGNTYITSGGLLNVGDKIISPGDIGLGTSTPAAKLALQNTNPNQTAFLIVGTTSQSNPLIDIYNNPTSNINLLRLSASGALSVAGNTTVGGLSIGNLSGLLFSTNGIVSTTSTSSLAINTDNLVQGSTNKFYSSSLFATSLAGTTTDALPQGFTNLYWSNTLFDNRFNPSFDTRLFATTSLSNLATLAGLSTIGSSTGQTTILGKTTMTNASTTNLTVVGLSSFTGTSTFSGNVGIGTTPSPTTKFQVDVGSLSIRDTYFDQSKIASVNQVTLSGGQMRLDLAWTCGSHTLVGPDGLTYGTVVGPDGRCWLDRNLGASQVATTFNDYRAYGSLFQWGRLADDHQKITWTSSSAGTVAHGTTATLSSMDNPGTDLFIMNGSSPYDWHSPKNDSLWQGVSGINNPCPTGFRLPTQPEWSTLVAAAPAITNSATAFSSSLKLVVAGYRYVSDGSLSNQGSGGYYWSSSPSGTYAYNLSFLSGSVNPAYNYFRAFGLSVRCIKN